LSTTAELLIYLGVIAAARVFYVVRKVRRERRRQPGMPGPADAYEGNLVVPAPGQHGRGHRHGIVHGGHGGFGGHGGGHAGHGGGHDAGGVHHH
jgi:hypothetical protein